MVASNFLHQQHESKWVHLGANRGENKKRLKPRPGFWVLDGISYITFYHTYSTYSLVLLTWLENAPFQEEFPIEHGDFQANQTIDIIDDFMNLGIS